MKKLFFFILTLTTLLACSKDDDTDNAPLVTPGKRTVIVYMVGPENLRNMMQYDINEIIEGRKLTADDNNLVVFVDKPSNDEKPYLARVTKDKEHPLEVITEYDHNFYSSGAEAMADVLRQAVSCCPATRDYGLVLWGHGNGWVIENDSVAADDSGHRANTLGSARRAYGLDSSGGEAETKGRWLNLPSMRKALEMAGVDWKYIFADCCNMLNAEVAYELRRHTKYLIGAPSEISGMGASYDVIVPDLFIEDDTEMIHAICDDYYSQIDFVGGHLPIGVLKTDAMDALAEATRDVLPYVADYLRRPDAMRGIIYYYAFNKNKEEEKVLYDMRDVVRAALADQQPDQYAQWQEALRNALVYNKMSTYWHANCVDFMDFIVTEEKFGGVSMFFPLEKYEATTSHHYNKDIRKTAWYYAVGWSEVGW